MVDEHFDRLYQESRSELNAGILELGRRLGTAVIASLNALHRIQYAAPWKAEKEHGASC